MGRTSKNYGRAMILSNKKEKLDFNTTLSPSECVKRIRDNVIITGLSNLGYRTLFGEPVGRLSGNEFMFYIKPFLSFYNDRAYYGELITNQGHTTIKGYFALDPVSKYVALWFRFMYFVLLPGTIITALISSISGGTPHIGILFSLILVLTFAVLYAILIYFENRSHSARLANKMEIIKFIEETLEARVVTESRQ